MAPVPADPDETSPSVKRIRTAALHLFAAKGPAAISLREVAAAAGVSVGLVQHHFSTKAGLVEAVDAEVLRVVTSIMAEPIGAPPADPVAEMGQRVGTLIAEHPDVVNYFSRAFVDGRPLGTMMFDALVASGAARWNEQYERGRTRPDLDLLWAPLHPLVLALGAVILRPHLDRHLPEPFGTARQLQRWEKSVNALLRHGQLRRPDNESD